MGRLSAVLNDPIRPPVVFRLLTYLGGVFLLHTLIAPPFISRFLVDVICMILSCPARTEDAFLILTPSDTLLIRIIPACTGFTDLLYYILLNFLFYGWDIFTRLRGYFLLGVGILLILTPLRILFLTYLSAYSPLLAERIHQLIAVWGSFLLILFLSLLPLLQAWRKNTQPRGEGKPT